ncbi:MAG: hypothetical protein ACR2PX_21440 [Endozoicomonas sp.]
MTFLDLFSDLTKVRADNHRYPLPHLVFIESFARGQDHPLPKLAGAINA